MWGGRGIGLKEEDVSAVQAIVIALYGDRITSRFNAGSITSETLELAAHLITETEECSKWIDSIPKPKDLLTPANSIRKWALRVIRAAGEPFSRGAVRISLTCKLTRGLQFKSPLEASLR